MGKIYGWIDWVVVIRIGEGFGSFFGLRPLLGFRRILLGLALLVIQKKIKNKRS